MAIMTLANVYATSMIKKMPWKMNTNGAAIAAAVVSAKPRRWAKRTKAIVENVAIEDCGFEENASITRVTGLTSAWPTLA